MCHGNEIKRLHWQKKYIGNPHYNYNFACSYLSLCIEINVRQNEQDFVASYELVVQEIGVHCING